MPVSPLNQDSWLRKLQLIDHSITRFEDLSHEALISYDPYRVGRMSSSETQTILNEAKVMLLEFNHNLLDGNNVPVPSYFHATTKSSINLIIDSGIVMMTPATYGMGAYVSTADEFRSYGNERTGSDYCFGYTIAFDSDVIEDPNKEVSVYPGESNSVYFQVGADIPVNSSTVSFICYDSEKVIPTGHKMREKFIDGPKIRLIDRRVAWVVSYIFNKVTTERYLPSHWLRLDRNRILNFPSNAKNFALVPFDGGRIFVRKAS